MTASIRPAAVAGMFYPTPSTTLLRCVDDLLATAGAADTTAATPHPPPKAIIVPNSLTRSKIPMLTVLETLINSIARIITTRKPNCCR